MIAVIVQSIIPQITVTYTSITITVTILIWCIPIPNVGIVGIIIRYMLAPCVWFILATKQAAIFLRFFIKESHKQIFSYRCKDRFIS